MLKKLDSHMPFGEWMDYWYREFCAPRLRKSTRETYSNRIYKQIIPKIGMIPLDELKNNDFQAFYSHLMTEGRLVNANAFGTGVSNSHIRHIHSHCSAALKKAIEEGLIYQNPATGCRLPPKVHGKITILTHDEIYRLLMQAMHDGMFEMLFLDLTTGIRRGELVALKWNDLNVSRSELKIRRQYTRINGKLVISKPKTPSAIRTIKLTKITMKVLKGYKQGACGEWMFPSSGDPTRPIDPEACGRKLTRILENAGCRHIRFHDIRHTFAIIHAGLSLSSVVCCFADRKGGTTYEKYNKRTVARKHHSARGQQKQLKGDEGTSRIHGKASRGLGKDLHRRAEGDLR